MDFTKKKMNYSYQGNVCEDTKKKEGFGKISWEDSSILLADFDGNQINGIEKNVDKSKDRSYNISFKFRSPYGHRLSIFENTLVPLMFLIAMTAPRAVGISSYTNPFYVKAFSKGLFSCDMGIITSLSISRGEDKNDRTFEGFFRTVSVSVSIKDVLPSLQMGLDAGMWALNKAANNSMISYMCNLAGVDFVERANLAKDTDRIVQNLRTSINDIGTNSRIWMAQSSLAGKIIGSTMRALGKGSSNPFNDRQFPKTFS